MNSKTLSIVLAGVIVVLIAIIGLMFLEGRSQNNSNTLGDANGNANAQQVNDTNSQVSPATNTATQPAAINICGITIPKLSFVSQSLSKDMWFESENACKYSTPDFTVLVLNKDTKTSDAADTFKAFAKYQQTQSAQEIPNFALTDTISTSIKGEVLFKKLGTNSVGYTAEIFQDMPGDGVYQTVTKAGNGNLVYLTYHMFPITDKTWTDYFDKNYSDSKENEVQVFNQYMAMTLKKQNVISNINELNSAASAIK